MSQRFTIDQLRTLKSSIVYLIAIPTLIVINFPIMWGLYNSFMPSSDLFRWPPTIVASELTLSQYMLLNERTPLFTYIVNSSAVAVIATVLVLLVAIPAAYSIARYEYPGRKYVASTSTIVYMFPYILIGIPFFILFQRLGLINSWFGLAITHAATGLPFALLLLAIFFKDVPKEIVESATLMGASRFVLITKIIIPLALPGIIAVAIFVFVTSWIEYFFALMLVTSQQMYTLPLGIANLFGIQQVNWGMVLAGIMVISIPPILVIFWLQKYLLKGFSVRTI